MPVKARINKLKKEIRCGLPDCNKLLFTGEITQAEPINIKCSGCDTINIVQETKIAEPLHKPDGPEMNGKSNHKANGATRKSKQESRSV